MPKSIFRNPLLLIPTVMLLAIGLVALLAGMALKPVYMKNGFNRQFLTSELQIINTIKKDEIITGIAGHTDHHIYFRTKNPAKLYVTGIDLKGGHYIKLNIPVTQKMVSAFFIEVDSPYVHIMAGNMPAIIETTLDGESYTAKKFPTAIFSRAVSVGNGSYIFRGFDTTLKHAGQVFIKGNATTNELTRSKSLAKQGNDGAGITNDGMLNYDRITGRAVYVSYYSNQFICFDTSLHLLYTGHTIDTTSRFNIAAGITGNMITNTTPARVINSKTKLADGNIYIVSRLKADNEDGNLFFSNSATDIYSVSNGAYEGSFYIPAISNEKLTDFNIRNDFLIVVYKTHLAIYRLRY